MELTEDEAQFASTSPPSSPPLRIKESRAPPRSNSPWLHTSPHNSSTVLYSSPPIHYPGINLASSLWPQNCETACSHPPSTPPSPNSPEPQPDPETDAVGSGRVDLRLISRARNFTSSEPLPPLSPRLPEISPPHAHPPLLPSPIISQKAGTGRNGFIISPATVNWGEVGSDFSTLSLDQNIQKARTFWAAIQERSVPVYLGTPNLDAFVACPSALGTYCSPAALMKALAHNDVFYHAYAAGQRLSKEDLIPSKNKYDGGVLQYAADAVLAEYGAMAIDRNTGHHFTFINVVPEETSDVIVRRSRQLVHWFRKKGITKDKVVVSIPATEQGVHATRLLAKEDGILVNLAMVAGMPHAAVCAEAGAAWITFHLDKLEKAHENLGEPSQGIKAIQSTIALFHMHNVETKIMISGFREIRKIVQFPGAHGFTVSKEQITSAESTNPRSHPVPPQSTASLPEYAFNRAERAKWPPRFFDAAEDGGSKGSFARCFPSRLQTVLVSSQRELFLDGCLAIENFLILVRDQVVGYKVFMEQLSNPDTGIRTMARVGVKQLEKIVNFKKDLRSAEIEWMETVTGRVLPAVYWMPERVDKCQVCITPDGRVVARIPKQWDRRKAASMNIEADF